ncbi:hypothetical protein HanRHA438_Chr06g0265431 [Helianthus annuus]|nr:hypothetical protein HanRHA438_Chr06g0265431 [Helianthus annuus]
MGLKSDFRLLVEVMVVEGMRRWWSHHRRLPRYFNIFNAVAVIIVVYLLFFDITGENGTTLS